MNETLTILSIYAATLTIYVLVCGAIWKGLTITENVLSKNRVTRFGAWFYQPFPKGFAQRIARHFVPMFDYVFEVRRRTIKGLGVVGFPRIWRSVIASLLTVSGFSLVWLALLPEEASLSFTTRPTFSLELEHPDFIVQFPFVVLLLPFCFNLICDYLSLAESRYVIRRIGASKSRARAAMWLLIDFVATYAIVIFVLSLVTFPMQFFGRLAMGQMDVFFRIINHIALIGIFTTIDGISSIFNFTFGTDYSIAYRRFGVSHWQWINLFDGIFVYSTFLTSIWVWLYFFSSYILKFLLLFNRVKLFMVRELNAAERPFTSIAWVSIAIISFVFWPSFIYFVVTA